MSEQTDRAIRLQSVMSHPGWRDIEAMAEEIISMAQQSLINMMDSRPEELTDRNATRLAARQKALKDFMESIRDEVRINLPSNSPQSARTGIK